MTLLLQILIIFLICLQPHALTTVISTYNLTYFTADFTYECIPKPSSHTETPEFFDCVNAIRQLPRINGYGSFHNGGPEDLYKLPVEKTAGTCTVSVELAHQGSTREAGDWLILIEAALSLTRRCLNPWLTPDDSAGVWIWYGQHHRITVTVTYYKIGNDGLSVETE